jgi:glycosyltransferase involved in cell wall biosynthesis
VTSPTSSSSPSSGTPRPISVVLPAKDEEHRIGRTLDRLVALVREAARHPAPDIRLVQHDVNRGKSTALRSGMRAAQGDIIALFDADLSVGPEHLAEAMALIEAGAEVVTGKRRQRGRQPVVRQLGSRLFALLQRGIVGLPFTDTQCPFKVMTREAMEAIVPRLEVERWNFDVEFLVVAQRLGFDTRELLVDWEHVDGSTIRLTPGYFIEQPRVLWQIRRRHGSASGRDARG